MAWDFKDKLPTAQPKRDVAELFHKEPSEWDKQIEAQRAKQNEPEEVQKRVINAWNSVGQRRGK